MCVCVCGVSICDSLACCMAAVCSSYYIHVVNQSVCVVMDTHVYCMIYTAQQ